MFTKEAITDHLAHISCRLRTGAAVAQRLLTRTAGGQRADGQRRRAGHRLQVLVNGRDGGSLRVNAVWTGKVLTAGWERTLPVGEPDGHLTSTIKPWRRSTVTVRTYMQAITM